jgi:hypothetical protein
MKISELRMALLNVRTKDHLGELDNLITDLQRFDNLTIGDFVDLLKKVKTPRVAQARTGAATKKLNESAIEAYLKRLNETLASSEEFDNIVDKLVADKRQMKQAELIDLAKRFGGATPTERKRDQIAAYLRSRRLEMRRQDGLGAAIDRMFGRR